MPTSPRETEPRLIRLKRGRAAPMAGNLPANLATHGTKPHNIPSSVQTSFLEQRSGEHRPRSIKLAFIRVRVCLSFALAFPSCGILEPSTRWLKLAQFPTAGKMTFRFPGLKFFLVKRNVSCPAGVSVCTTDNHVKALTVQW